MLRWVFTPLSLSIPCMHLGHCLDLWVGEAAGRVAQCVVLTLIFTMLSSHHLSSVLSSLHLGQICVVKGQWVKGHTYSWTNQRSIVVSQYCWILDSVLLEQ